MDILDIFWTFDLNHLSPLWGYFFSVNGLDVIVLLSLVLFIWLCIVIIQGKWSLMSFSMMLDSVGVCSLVLRNTLSIRVALFVVILVGFDIVGSRFFFRLVSKNSFVCEC